MTASKTRHLDTAISIFKGSDGAKRAARKAQAEVAVWASAGAYSITVNGKVVESAAGNETDARNAAEKRAETIRKLGKSCIVTVY